MDTSLRLRELAELIDIDPRGALLFADELKVALLELAAIKQARESIAYERQIAMPIEPEPACIESMALRVDHGHGIRNSFAGEDDAAFARRQESNRSRARQMYEEATGSGFFKRSLPSSQIAPVKVRMDTPVSVRELAALLQNEITGGTVDPDEITEVLERYAARLEQSASDADSISVKEREATLLRAQASYASAVRGEVRVVPLDAALASLAQQQAVPELESARQQIIDGWEALREVGFKPVWQTSLAVGIRAALLVQLLQSENPEMLKHWQERAEAMSTALVKAESFAKAVLKIDGFKFSVHTEPEFCAEQLLEAIRAARAQEEGMK